MTAESRVESRESSEAVKSYRGLLVWQKAMDPVERVYAVTAGFPEEEICGLTSQIRRAAVSVPSNLAEGSSRRSTNEFVRFINTACGSLAELETQLLIAERLNYAAPGLVQPALQEADEISRMLQGLHRTLEKRLH